jgi:DNA-directed RNA polymerase subunit RPC12/RpoP
MESVTKIRCPHCGGKIGIENDYYSELVGSVISCPHCGNQMIVPVNASQAVSTTAGSHSLDRTQEIQIPPEWNKPFQNAVPPAPAAPPRPPAQAQAKPAAGGEETRRCPYCQDDVGRRDRICISCGHKIPLSEPPPGFSQIRA